MEHISPKRTYILVWAVLMCLTVLTAAVSFVDLGPFSAPVALFIATCKALLVVLFFMHVRYSTRLTKLVVVGGFMWLALLIGLTMADEATRAWIPMPPT